MENDVENQIKRLKAAYQVDNESQLARAFGLSNSSIFAGWRKRKQVPILRIKQASLETGVDFNFIKDGVENINTQNNENLITKLMDEMEFLKIENEYLKKKIAILEKQQ
jgi:hypothetical protein